MRALYHFDLSFSQASIDIEISVSVLTFVTLWKVKRPKDAFVYLES